MKNTEIINKLEKANAMTNDGEFKYIIIDEYDNEYGYFKFLRDAKTYAKAYASENKIALWVINYTNGNEVANF